MTDESTATDTEGGDERAVRLSVPEMDCPSCAGKVENRLDRVEAVGEVDTRPTTGVVSVGYDAGRASEDDIVGAIEQAGYEVTGGDGDETAHGVDVAPPSAVWTSRRALTAWAGAAVLVVGLVLEFLLTGLNYELGTPLSLGVADVAFLAAAATSGVPVVRSGIQSARARSLDIDLLMGTAIVAATGVGLYVEAATLAVLFSIAELLEQYAMDQTRDSLRELLELAPEEATVRRDGTERTIPVDEVAVGDTVVVRPGEKIPVDGIVREGESAVDQSPITGESVPVDRGPGDEVYAGTFAEEGYLELEATTDASGTTLARIIDLVGEAQAETTETEQFVDRFAAYYTPAVVVLAVLTAVVPPFLVDGSATVAVAGLTHTFAGGWSTWFVRGLTLLVIACPCAFVISTPVSVASGVTAAARNGVLVKGGTHLEAMGEVDAIAFDKTGTLTKGELTVTDVVPAEDASTDDVLRYAGALERGSDHPIADAVLDRVETEGLSVPDADGFETLTGRGVRARIDGRRYAVGKPALFGIDTDGGAVTDGGGMARESGDRSGSGEPGRPDSGDAGAATLSGRERSAIERLQREGKTVVLVGTGSAVVGVLGVADEVRPGAKRAIEALHGLGVAPLVMLTGDNEGTARAVAEELGIDEYRAELLPDEKVAAIEELEGEQGAVAMVGDGVNDAPALAAASVGVAMGAAGTDTAIETADIALMGDDLGMVPYLHALADRARGVIRQNIWSSLGVKLLLAVGVPFGYVSVAVAVLVGDMGMSLGVTGNAMRLSRLRPETFLDS
jgi:Cd2+/Zn2+-exporting ATPase